MTSVPAYPLIFAVALAATPAAAKPAEKPAATPAPAPAVDCSKPKQQNTAPCVGYIGPRPGYVFIPGRGYVPKP